MASTPQIAATTTSLTVSSRKKAAVKTAASTCVQLGPGIWMTYCGVASIGVVTSVSRPPVGALGRKCRPSSTSRASSGCSQSGSRLVTKGMRARRIDVVRQPFERAGAPGVARSAFAGPEVQEEIDDEDEHAGCDG